MKTRTRLTDQEPDFQAACTWWSDLPDIWTPVGWKNHLFRFNVFWNGMIMAQPDCNRRTEAWKGQGVQLTFLAATPFVTFEDFVPLERTTYTYRDDGMVQQGWEGTEAPVLWTEWSADGVLLRQHVFAHIPGGGEVQTGVEPLFAWIRLSIRDTCEGIPLNEKHGFLITLDAPHVSCGMSIRNNVRFHNHPPEKMRYPRDLRLEGHPYDPSRATRVLEPDGRVRLAVLPGQRCRVEFSAGTPNIPRYLLYVQFDARKGRHVDLLLPMLPTDQETIDREMSLGYDRAFREANRFWSRKPATAARFVVPEMPVTEAVTHSLKMGEVIAEKNPADGQYSILSGSFHYANLWATPHSMACIMLLDSFGYHDAVSRYLEIFRKEQGTVKPPGKSFQLHPGYLSSPKSLTSIDWLTDHGALLYTISEHALLSGDPDFLARWLDPILKACEFIRNARAITGHGGAEGIMPAAIATDNCNEIQSVWTDGWMFKALTTAVRVLERAAHPRATEFAAEARAYAEAFDSALHRACRTMPRWKDARGRQHHLVPTAISGPRLDLETRGAFYLDAGPLFLVYSGLLDARDERMASTLLWFRQGPPRRFYRYDGNLGQLPSLEHEMSSCEPCYSWNVFHSWQLADRQKFLGGLYSLFAGSLSRKTYTSCETRGGITGTTFSSPLAVYLARLAVVDDQIRDGELHLLRLMPLAWTRPGCEAQFEKMPTRFGPVTLITERSRDGKTFHVRFTPHYRCAPRRTVLHLPPIAGLRRVLVNDRTVSVGSQRVVHLGRG
ncbi:MAG: hypothetical protein HYU36_06575 [Planctomycetes bacterium]|nr:hypothetical protein [Planctomycetota bacterium]